MVKCPLFVKKGANEAKGHNNYEHKGIEKGKSDTLVREILSRNTKDKQPEEKQKAYKPKKKYIPPKYHPWRNKLSSKIGHF